jgi:hypothetical protein
MRRSDTERYLHRGVAVGLSPGPGPEDTLPLPAHAAPGPEDTFFTPTEGDPPLGALEFAPISACINKGYKWIYLSKECLLHPQLLPKQVLKSKMIPSTKNFGHCWVQRITPALNAFSIIIRKECTCHNGIHLIKRSKEM